MKKFLQFILYLSIVSLFLAGCEGCFDGEITRKVDYPFVTVTEDTNYEITFESGTKGASFRYTIDGTDPLDSKTAVDGTTLTIDFFTEVRVYAYKDGFRNSAVVYYRIPTTNAMREVNYNPEDGPTKFFVTTHRYIADDVFGREKIEITYNAKGTDDQWFSDDDQVLEYTLFNYAAGNKVINSYHYTSAGSDGKWLTKDDDYDSYSEFTVDALGRKSTESIKAKDGSETSSKSYTWNGEGNNLAQVSYSGGKKTVYTYGNSIYPDLLTTEQEYDGASLTKTITYSATNGTIESASSSGVYTDYTNAVELNKRYKKVVTYDGAKIAEKRKFLGYGEDTDVGITTYVYDGDKIAEEHVYENKAGTFEVKYTYFTYEGDKVIEEEIHERFWSKDLYDWDWTIIIKKYQYNEDGTFKRIEYYNDEKFMSLYENFTYESGFGYKDTFERPELPKKTITVDLTITAEGSIDGGSYAMDGQNFDVDGDPIGEIIDIPADQKEFMKAARAKIKEVVENTDIDAQGLTLKGKVAGSVRVEGDAYTDGDNNGKIKVWFYFDEYDDGDMMIDGELLSEFEGKFDISGKISGRGTGYIQGSVIVEDGNPDWTDKDYNQINYTVITLDSNLDPKQEIVYNGTGADSDWKKVEDNTVEKFILYTVNGAVKTKSVRIKSGTDAVWGNADDVELERFVDEYSGDQVVKEEYFSNYGLYTRDFQGTDTNGTLTKAQLKYHTWCHWDYHFGWNWENL